MLQAYVTGLSVAEGQDIAFPKVERIGTTVTGAIGSTTIQLNAPGVYMVSFNATGTTTAAGTFGFQMQRDGVAVPQAQASATTAAGDSAGVAFSTLMSVNRCCQSANGVVLSFRYTGGAGTVNLANVVVTKVR